MVEIIIGSPLMAYFHLTLSCLLGYLYLNLCKWLYADLLLNACIMYWKLVEQLLTWDHILLLSRVMNRNMLRCELAHNKQRGAYTILGSFFCTVSVMYTRFGLYVILWVWFCLATCYPFEQLYSPFLAVTLYYFIIEIISYCHVILIHLSLTLSNKLFDLAFKYIELQNL